MAWSFKTYDHSVLADLATLDASQKAGLQQAKELLDEFGVTGLGMPLSKPLGGGLFELRLQGAQTTARVFYCYHGREILVFLLVFVKKTQKTPRDILETAKRRMKEVKNGRR